MGLTRKAASLSKKFGVAGAMILGLASAAYAADIMAMKAAPAAAAPPPPASCTNFWDFIATACPLTWYGVTVYGTVDMGGSYMTHGAPFDRNFPTGVPYLLGGGGANATNRTPGFFLGPNGLSQSNIGIKVNEPIAPGGLAFVAQAELAYDPYSLLLSNAPQAMQNAIGVPQNQAESPIDSSRWGWLAGTIDAGFSSPVWGTLTFGHQNALENDAIVAYDPMGASYAFSPIGFSGKAAGAGDTEDARWGTAIKYRVNIGDFRVAAMGQPLGYGAYNPNNGAVAGDIGGDIKHFGPGTLSLDFIATWEKDAVNIGPKFLGTTTNAAGWPTGFGGGTFLVATISNQTNFMALAKYDMKPVVPLTFYAGYEWIQFANPSDPQSAFRDDGFFFFDATALTPAGHGGAASFNNTAINNHSFNAFCASGSGLAGGKGVCSNEIFQIMWTGAKYGITKDLDFITGWYHYIQSQYIDGVSCAVAAGNSKCAGWFDTASVVLDWRFLPKWDAYIGTMYSAAFGGIANADIARNNLATTAGVRFRF